MQYRIIKAPSDGTKEILKKRIGIRENSEIGDYDTIGLVQGPMIDMICASDVAQKATGVMVYDVKGICPQHMVLLAIFGSTSSVEDALSIMDDKLKSGTYNNFDINVK
ncbi:MAG: BMC domain protein [Peptostreptococcaceae bacterium]|nr:BMC domain protein [Peptostreptococcaceae bacterium]